jgi:hypothetical protein
MFDVVAPYDDKLALTIEIESIDDAEPHLPRAAARHSEPTPKGEPENKQDEHGSDEKRERRRDNLKRPVPAEQITQGLHASLVSKRRHIL